MSAMEITAERAPAVRSATYGEIGALALLLVLMNFPLFVGGSTEPFAFDAAAVEKGEWWRVLTHPFAHISIYHFLLDGAAFLLLWSNLPPMRVWGRLALLVGAGAGSLLFSLAFSPLIGDLGLRGLSGIAHGLMAAGALAGLEQRETRTISALTFFGLAAKCICENLTGAPVFDAWHFGSVGTPIVTCHAGGALGGIAVHLLAPGEERAKY